VPPGQRSAAGFPLPGPRLPTIEADAVRLRWLEAGDIDQLYALFSDPETVRHMNLPVLASHADAERLLEQIGDEFVHHRLYQWGVALASDDRVVGTCTLASLDRNNRRAEIGFALAPSHRGQRLMTTAASALIEFAFDRMRLHRVEADVDPANTPSIRLLERLGFEHEGRLRERWLSDGQPADSLMMGLLASEWRTRGNPA
jgi:RimJ/RimL family protein N-acetyltransferase